MEAHSLVISKARLLPTFAEGQVSGNSFSEAPGDEERHTLSRKRELRQWHPGSLGAAVPGRSILQRDCSIVGKHVWGCALSSWFTIRTQKHVDVPGLNMGLPPDKCTVS